MIPARVQACKCECDDVKLLVIGAAGQLGSAATATLAARHEVIAWTRADLDLADTCALGKKIGDVRPRPDAIINCAAYNNVDGAEDDPVSALAVNAMAVRGMAEAAQAIGATLVHYSTDFVFDGEVTPAQQPPQPYVETDRARPQSTYGASKLLGEWFAQQVASHYVLRVESLFGGPHTRSSVDKIIASLKRGDEARVFSDRIVSPSFVDDVVFATERLLERRAPVGLYHCVNSGHTTWLELAQEIARLLGKADARLVPVRVAEVPMRAKRPQYCALSNARLSAAMGAPMPTWQDALARHVALVAQT
jgi:dTDP-4-dehydrorhamnose reductase